MIRLGVIGCGTASLISIISVLSHCKLNNWLERIKIECIYDPNIPMLTVGEGISPSFHHVLKSTLGFNMDDLAKVDGTIRWGGRHFWEENLGKEFNVMYGSEGIHINSEKFSKYLLTKVNEIFPDNFTEYHDNVTNVVHEDDKVKLISNKNTYVYDYVIECTGSPTDVELASSAYEFPDFESVNSVVIFPEFKIYDEQYTTNLFHQNGWMFGIPLRHRKAFGYLYNNSITSKEEAIIHFKKLKPDIEVEKLRSLNWKHYYKKEAMQDKVLSMGNKLYFFEPAQGLPLHYCFHISSLFADLICNNFFSPIDISSYINLYHNIHMQKIQDLIALNYAGENNMNSNFWQTTKEKARIRLKDSDRFREWCKNNIDLGYISQYCFHTDHLMRQYIEGFNINTGDLLNQ